MIPLRSLASGSNWVAHESETYSCIERNDVVFVFMFCCLVASRANVM